MRSLFFLLIRVCFLWVSFVSPILASVAFVDDLNFTFEESKTGPEGNVARITEKSSFFAVDTLFDVNKFHDVLKSETEKTGIQDSNLVTVGFSLVYKTGVQGKPYIVATDTLDFNRKFSIIYESGFSDRPKDSKKKCVYASCGPASKDEIRYPLEDLFGCIKDRYKSLAVPSQEWFNKWSHIQIKHSEVFLEKIALEKNSIGKKVMTLEELKNRAETCYQEARQGIMEEGIGSVTDSEQIFLCHDWKENIIGLYFKKLDEKINSYKEFLEETVKKNAPFLFVESLNFEPVHFGVHLYTTNEMCRFCGDSLVARLMSLRCNYSLPVNIFVSYGRDIIPESEDRRPAGFSHLIDEEHDHYSILKVPSLTDKELKKDIVFQKKMT